MGVVRPEEGPARDVYFYNDPGYAPVRSDMHARLEKLQQECGDTDPCEREYEFFRGADRL